MHICKISQKFFPKVKFASKMFSNKNSSQPLIIPDCFKKKPTKHRQKLFGYFPRKTLDLRVLLDTLITGV